MNRLSVVIITLNEEGNIRRCLESVRWADEIVLVDSYSTDKTLDKARAFSPRVFQRRFDNFASQKNFALEKARFDWVLSVDADEVVDQSLKEEIRAKLSLAEPYDGYCMPRRNYFLGKELRHGGIGEDLQLRLFRKDKARFANLVHERVTVNGKVEELKNPIYHYSFETMDDYFRKFRQYTTLEAALLKEENKKVTLLDIYLKPYLRFIYTYFIKLGFLDGFKGFFFYVLSSLYMAEKFAKYKKLMKGEPCA
ncbi:MAG: glycosyltransferase family 2 protein [Candidatus Omnitrophica bacterium]|nr:glycosyltransferase family 2 protein [Candidatus Omnitrophota bacterium]